MGRDGTKKICCTFQLQAGKKKRALVMSSGVCGCFVVCVFTRVMSLCRGAFAFCFFFSSMTGVASCGVRGSVGG